MLHPPYGLPATRPARAWPKFANCERWQRIVGCVERTAREMVGCARSRTLENTYRCFGPVRVTHHLQGFRAPPTLRLALPQGWPVCTTCREPGRPRPNLLGRSVPGGCPWTTVHDLSRCSSMGCKFADIDCPRSARARGRRLSTIINACRRESCEISSSAGNDPRRGQLPVQHCVLRRKSFMQKALCRQHLSGSTPFVALTVVDILAKGHCMA